MRNRPLHCSSGLSHSLLTQVKAGQVPHLYRNSDGQYSCPGGCPEAVQAAQLRAWLERGYTLPLTLTPCQLWRHLEGRTLWLMGEARVQLSPGRQPGGREGSCCRGRRAPPTCQPHPGSSRLPSHHPTLARRFHGPRLLLGGRAGGQARFERVGQEQACAERAGGCLCARCMAHASARWSSGYGRRLTAALPAAPPAAAPQAIRCFMREFWDSTEDEPLTGCGQGGGGEGGRPASRRRARSAASTMRRRPACLLAAQARPRHAPALLCRDAEILAQVAFLPDWAPARCVRLAGGSARLCFFRIDHVRAPCVGVCGCVVCRCLRHSAATPGSGRVCPHLRPQPRPAAVPADPARPAPQPAACRAPTAPTARCRSSGTRAWHRPATSWSPTWACTTAR